MEEVHFDIEGDKGKEEADACLAESEPPRSIEQVRDIGSGIKNVFLMVAEPAEDTALPLLVKWSGYSCPIILHAQRLVSGTPLVSLAVGECLQPGFVTSKLGAEETGADGPLVIRCMLETKKKNQSNIALICSMLNTTGTTDEKLMVLRIKTDLSDALSSTPCLEEPPYAPSLELLMHTIQQTALAQEDTRGAKSSLLPPGESRVAKKMPQVKTETVKEEDVVVVPDQKAAILEEYVKDIRTVLKNFVGRKNKSNKIDPTKPMTKLVAAMEKNTAALEKFQARMRSLEEAMQRCTDAFEDQQRRDVSNDTRELNREETVMRINNGGTRYVVQGGKLYGSHGTEINRNTDGSFQLRPPLATTFNQARQIALDNFDIDVDEEEPAPPSRNNGTTPKSSTKKRARQSEEESSFTWYCECEDVEHSSNTKFCRSCKTKQSADRRLH